MTRRIGFPAVLLAALALALPGAALAVLLSVEGEGSGLAIVVQPPGSGVVSAPGFYCEDECIYEGESPVTFTAAAKPGYLFKGWGRCDTGGVNGRECTVTVTDLRDITAKFVKTQDLTVSKAEGSGPGKVNSLYGVTCLAGCKSATVALLDGKKVIVKETPAKHFHFVEWLGDCTGSGPCELLMDEDHEVEALFAEDPSYALTLTKAGAGLGIVKSKPAGISCSYLCTASEALFYKGEAIVLEAVANHGDTFEGWSGGGCSGMGTCTVAMTEAREVVADFGPTFEALYWPPCPPPKVCVAVP